MDNKNKIKFFFGFALIIIFLISSGYSMNYYVNTTGSDANDGSINSPFLTIQRAINIASNKDSILVAKGEYNLTNPILINKSINLYGDDKKTILNAPLIGNDKDVFQIIVNDVLIDGFTIQGAKDVATSPAGRTNSGIAVGGDWFILGSKPNNATDFTFSSWWGIGVSNITIINNNITNNSYGIFLFHSQNITIKNNNIYNNSYDGDVAGTWSGKGIEIYTSQDMSDNSLATSGNALNHTKNVLIENNKIYDNELFGIELNYAESWNGGDVGPFDANVTIINNEIYNNGKINNYPWENNVTLYRGITSNGNEKNVLIKNNIIYGHFPKGDYTDHTIYCSGIRLSGSNEFNITNNEIFENIRGIRAYGNSENINITFNNIYNNTQGVYVDGNVGFAHENVIKNNILEGYNTYGFLNYTILHSVHTFSHMPKNIKISEK
jgi:parallel beta-helix repeat protein